jgi:hypothetical protein
MSKQNAKWWLALAALLLVTPAFSAAQRADKAKGCGNHDRDDRKCRQVPEGGSAPAYLLGAGATCLGAMFVRSRLGNPRTL